MCNRLLDKDFSKGLDRLHLQGKENIWVKGTHKCVEETIRMWRFMLVIQEEHDCLRINAS